jgi:hypothetical protein
LPQLHSQAAVASQLWQQALLQQEVVLLQVHLI